MPIGIGFQGQPDTLTLLGMTLDSPQVQKRAYCILHFVGRYYYGIVPRFFVGPGLTKKDIFENP